MKDQVEMLRMQVKELKGAPADQVVRVSLATAMPACRVQANALQVDEKRKRADDAA